MGYLLMDVLASLYGASVALLAGALASLLVTFSGWVWRKLVHQNATG